MPSVKPWSFWRRLKEISRFFQGKDEVLATWWN
jgi:hypothetical protein